MTCKIWTLYLLKIKLFNDSLHQQITAGMCLFILWEAPLTFTPNLVLLSLSLSAGAPLTLCTSSSCCHGDESWHKCQAGGHDVSQDLHPKARQRQVTSEELRRRGGGQMNRDMNKAFLKKLMFDVQKRQNISKYQFTLHALFSR